MESVRKPELRGCRSDVSENPFSFGVKTLLHNGDLQQSNAEAAHDYPFPSSAHL